MTNLGLTPESRELDDLIQEKLNPPKEELNHEWIKPSLNFYASHKKSTKIIKTVAAILGCSSMVRHGDMILSSSTQQKLTYKCQTLYIIFIGGEDLAYETLLHNSDLRLGLEFYCN